MNAMVFVPRLYDLAKGRYRHCPSLVYVGGATEDIDTDFNRLHFSPEKSDKEKKKKELKYTWVFSPGD